jgi:hypothetical protein
MKFCRLEANTVDPTPGAVHNPLRRRSEQNAGQHGAQVMRSYLTLAVLLASCAGAHARTEQLDTSATGYTKWKVYEMTGGVKVVGAPVYVGTFGFGDVPGVTIPFSDCDGYWVAERRFTIPTGAKNALLSITGVSVDDRIVVKINGVAITAAGTTSAGKGKMQLKDPGRNRIYTFPYKAGKISVQDSADLKPGKNKLTIIVNNTGDGIHGTIVPVTKSSPSNAGIEAALTFADP